MAEYNNNNNNSENNTSYDKAL